MKRFLLYLVCLAVVLACILAVNDVVCKYLVFADSSNSAYKMWRLYKGHPKNETAILGSSRAVSSFLPSIIGEDMFNYGVNGAGQNETVQHLKSVIARGENRPIIINLDPWGMRDDKMWADYSYVRHDVVDSMPGLRSFGKMRNLMDGYIRTKRGSGMYTDCGAGVSEIVRPIGEWQVLVNKINPALLQFSIDDIVLREYETVLAGKHPPIYFVITPIHRAWKEKFDGTGKLKELERRLLSHRDVYVIDAPFLSEEYGDDVFFDVTHLNRRGAEKFSRDFKQLFDAH